jgi:beta-glucanase (GH16 family)
LPNLVFDEEFNSVPANTPSGRDGSGNATWRTEWSWGARWTNDETGGGYWADSTVGYNPFSSDNGVVSITAKPLNQTGATGAQWFATHATGMLTTDTLFAQQYGYFEIRAQAAKGDGFGTGLWMLPQDHSWPPEIDIQEIPGRSVDSGGVIMTTHSNNNGSQPGWTNVGTDLSAGMHTYGLNWGPDQITWYIDGKEVQRTATPGDMHKPMYLLMTLETGTNGSWWGNTDDNASGSLKVDYVRVWDGQSGGPPPGAVGGGSQVAASPTPSQGSGDVAAGSTTIGSGDQSLVLHIAQDAWQGDAQYTVSVDGNQVGGTLTASAAHSSGGEDLITVKGNWGGGAHRVSINFLNDAYGGSGDADRNLYVNSVSHDGASLGGGKVLYTQGTADYAWG